MRFVITQIICALLHLHLNECTLIHEVGPRSRPHEVGHLNGAPVHEKGI